MTFGTVTKMASPLKRVAEIFCIEEFNKFQEDTLSELLNKRDVFLSVKTGGGKSLCYQAFQPLWEERYGEHCCVLIISPLISIMEEQCDILKHLGFKATFIGRNTEEEQEILAHKFDFLYSSPELILSLKKWRDLLQDSSHSFRLFVVDEAHTVLHWGEGEAGEDPFRRWYAQLGEVRSLITCPVLLITATASKASRKHLKVKFGMRDCKEIIQNPDRENVKLFVSKIKPSTPLCEVFHFLINLLKQELLNCPRYLIFCTSIKDCAALYTMFRCDLTQLELQHINMFHSNTSDAVKRVIKEDMEKPDGIIRILIATSAAGMGVNYCAVNDVVNYGPPRDMDTFMQQIGRAGRDSNASARSLLLYHGRQCKLIDSDMKNYISEDQCRRKCLLCCYNASPSSNMPKHTCCDICSAKCECNADDCDKFSHTFFESQLSDSSSATESYYYSSDEGFPLD